MHVFTMPKYEFQNIIKEFVKKMTKFILKYPIDFLNLSPII